MYKVQPTYQVASIQIHFLLDTSYSTAGLSVCSLPSPRIPGALAHNVKSDPVVWDGHVLPLVAHAKAGNGSVAAKRGGSRGAPVPVPRRGSRVAPFGTGVGDYDAKAVARDARWRAGLRARLDIVVVVVEGLVVLLGPRGHPRRRPLLPLMVELI